MDINRSDVWNSNVPQGMLMPENGFTAAAVGLTLIGIFGFFFNLFVIVLMWKDKQLWTPLNIILFNLVCSDFSVSVLGNPWTLSSAISNGWIFGRTMCVIYGFFMSLLGISSITTLTVLAFERYLIVSRPFRTKYVSRCNAAYVILGIWIYSLFLTIPPLLGWGKYVNEAANISCSVNWEDRSVNAKTYILYLFIFGLIIPLVVITYSYIHIIRTMRKKKVKTGKVSRVEGRVAYMVLIMITAFLIAWTPYSIFALIAQFGDPSYITPATGVLPALIAKSSICYNPIIYVILNTQFRQSVKQLLRRRNLDNNSIFMSAARPSQYLSQTTHHNDSDNKLLKKGNKFEDKKSLGKQHIIEEKLKTNMKPDGKFVDTKLKNNDISNATIEVNVNEV